MSVKAFELVSAVERELLMGDKLRINIECIECCGKNLYVGTNDCFIFHFLLEERTSSGGKLRFSATKQLHKYLGLKKPVNELKAASALNRLLVLCDNSITLVNMINLEPIPSGAKIKGALAFTVNENPTNGDPFCVEVCIISVKRRTIQIYMVYEDRVQIVKEVSTPEQPIAVAVDGYFLCLALTTQYIILNYNTGTSQDLFPYNSEEKRPIIKRIGRQEFLLAGPGGLGKLILSTNKEVYILVPLPLEKQIQDLLASHRVEEALVLAKGARRNIPKEKFQVMYRRILQQAGFIQFAQLQFLEAKELFRSGQLDVRELISLYPFLMPSTSTFTRAHPPLHEYADLNQLTQGNQEKITKCKCFLMSYLNEIRSSDVANGYKEDVDTALLKLYAEANHESLLDLLVSENSCLLVDSAPWLEKHKKYFALGLLYHYSGQDDAAVQLWVKIVNGDLQDTTRSDLYEYIVDFLSFCSNHELVWKYADWALQKNEKVGVQIFTKRPLEEQQTNSLNPDDAIKYLTRYPKAVTAYLEHLVLDQKVRKEKYHTHLAVLYLDEILRFRSQSKEPSEGLTELQAKLRHLLQQSDLYRVQLLLGKIKDTDLHMECAMLYGKLEEHDKALHLLVHKIRDFPAAEDYCLWNSEGRESSYRRRLFHMLLSVYLDSAASSDGLVMAAVDLLNNHAAEFDAVGVLRRVPDSWSIQLLSPFLMGAMRESLHSDRMAQLSLGLARAENMIYKYDKVKLKGTSFVLSEKKICQICRRPFSEPVFVRYPSGTLVHTYCAANKLSNSVNPNSHT
nr:PREDICTED: transforming growth factor-beta receptor-associated protein 1 [Latimeria chalumnae]|eukprot:XP_014345144.1 PREDICTED: transforming growth factor-beta receptor-associated protein 1 [Latimeria chalumnae]